MTTRALAEALLQAAVCLGDAVDHDDPEVLGAALEERERAFEALSEAARGGLDGPTRVLVEEVLQLDLGVQERARTRLAAVRAELDQLAQVRRVIGSQARSATPRLVSRRA